MRAAPSVTLVFLAALAGCGDSGGTDAPPEATPITERESDDAFACSVSEDLINFKPLTWSYAGGNVVETEDGQTWLVRLEADGTQPFMPGPFSFLVSTVAPDGTVADGTTIPVDNIDIVGSPRGIAIDGGLAVLWIEHNELRFAALDHDGAITQEPKSILTHGSLEPYGVFQLARSSSGKIAALWHTPSNTMFVAITDELGSDAVVVPFDEPAQYEPRIAGIEDGFSVLWSSVDPDAVEPGNVFFSRIDASGALRGEPVQLTDFGGHANDAWFSGNQLAILPRGEGYLVAWNEGSAGDFERQRGGYSVLRVQALNGEGEPQGESALIAPRADDVDYAEPSFVPWDDDTVAVLWARGSRIYICGGCIPDHSVSMMLIDPETLSPRSNVATVEPPEVGGLLNRHHARSGTDQLLVSLDIRYHVHSDPGFAALRCEAQ